MFQNQVRIDLKTNKVARDGDQEEADVVLEVARPKVRHGDRLDKRSWQHDRPLQVLPARGPQRH